MAVTATQITLLSQGVGYGVVVGLGVLFALVILAAVKVQKKYLDEDSGKSEMFMVANRTVGIGLTCSAVFSSWMWINETVFSAVQCFKFGIAAPLWFATGVGFQISLMAVLGVVVKMRVPNAHTSLEIVRVRYGRIGHLTFIWLNLINNIIGCSAMIVTGSQLLYGLTGVNIAAATVLIPLGVVLYTAVGGLKATFLTDFLHTTIALILIIYFTISILTSKTVGGYSGLYDALVATAGDQYISGNYEGSLLTFKSKGAILFGIILKFGNLAYVIMDTAFWQKSFATEVRATVPGYNLAAISIFSIPWAMGTVMGLTARAFQHTSVYYFLPNGFTTAQINSGFVMPYTIHAFLGAGGSAGMLLLLFMAVTSTVSSSMIAVSSILSYDIYRTYINPKATDKQTVAVSHLGVVIHGALVIAVTMGLNYGGANINWLSYSMNMIKCPGIFPLIFTILWSRQSKLAACASPLIGMAAAIGVWLGTAKAMYGEINLTTTGDTYPALYSALTATFLPAVLSLLISYLGPKEEFDWNIFLSIELVSDDAIPGDKRGAEGAESDTSAQQSADEKVDSSFIVRPVAPRDADPPVGPAENDVEKITPMPATTNSPPRRLSSGASVDLRAHPLDPATLSHLRSWLKFAWIFLITFVLITFVAWPLPLYRDYIFPKSFFGGWVTVAIVWQFFALFAVVIYPVYDGWDQISAATRGLWATWKSWRVGATESTVTT